VEGTRVYDNYKTYSNPKWWLLGLLVLSTRFLACAMNVGKQDNELFFLRWRYQIEKTSWE